MNGSVRARRAYEWLIVNSTKKFSFDRRLNYDLNKSSSRKECLPTTTLVLIIDN